MKNIKWLFLLLAILGTLSLAGIGISLAEKSIIGVFISIVVFIGIFGFGFIQKKKMREQGMI